MADLSFDVVYVGAGSKSLINAMYVAKYGGMTVGMFEDRYEAGGGWASEESPAPGFIANHCSHVHTEIYHDVVYQDFPEWENMLNYVHTRLCVATIFREDDSWIGRYSKFADPNQEKTAKLIARFSEKDAETYLWMWDKYQKYWREPIWEAAWSPPKPFGELGALDLLMFNPDSGINPVWSFMSPIQVAADLFESPATQMMYLRNLQSGGIMPDDYGMGLMIPLSLPIWETIIFPGGNHSIAHAAQRVILENGGKIFHRSTVDKIIIENGQAKGIRLADGTEIEAKKAVVCGCNPEQLVFELTGPEYWDPKIPRKVRNIRSDFTTITWYTWALHERPKYKAEAFDPDLPYSSWTLAAMKDVGYVEREQQRRRAGLWPDPENFNLVMADWSIYDPSFAPPGKACILTEQFVLPATAYSEQEWKEIEKRHADEVVSFWQKYAPNMTWDNVIGYVPITPYFTAKHARNYAPHGNWHVIDLIPSQLGSMRPIPELADVRNFPIKNLYPCSTSWGLLPGAESHQGYWVYKIMAEQFGLRKPWEEKGRPY